MASVAEEIPINMNFLSPLNFRFQLKRAPYLNFFIQKCTLPTIELPQGEIPTPFTNINNYATNMEFSPRLTVTFKVDENLANYIEVHSWLRALGSPENRLAYQALVNAGPTTGEGLSSEVSLTVLNSLKRPNYEIVFQNVYPISLSGIAFDTTNPNVDFVEATAEFSYHLYTINQIT